jgi:hypothetical protein
MDVCHLSAGLHQWLKQRAAPERPQGQSQRLLKILRANLAQVSDPSLRARLERRENIAAFCDLIEEFQVEPVFDRERFLGLVDVMRVPMVVTAID